MALLPRRHQVLNAQTLTGAGNSGELPNLGQSATPVMIAVLNIAGAVTGGGTLTINIYANIAGQGQALIDSFTETAALSAPVRRVYTNILEDQVYVSWTVTGGSSPSFGGVSLDLLFPSPDA